MTPLRFIDLVNSGVPLDEVHYADVYPRGFQQFVKEWRGRKKDKSLYVQFTHNGGDVLSRSANPNPEHGDPAGTYAYPLAYVIDHPADLWYGHGAKRIRILRDKSKMSVVLSDMDWWFVKSLLQKVDLISDIDLAMKLFPDRAKGITAPGKIFMSVITLDLSKCEISWRRRKPTMEQRALRTPAEQTMLLRKMGVDALIDRASTGSRASINDREPEQAVFLIPQAFEVLTTYRLADPADKWRKGVQVTDEPRRLPRKLAAALAHAMGDRISDVDEAGDGTFWTRGGRVIEVRMEDTSIQHRMDMNARGKLKFGGKIHKMYRKANRHSVTATVKTERGEFYAHVYSDGTVGEAVEGFLYQWTHAADKPDSGERYTRERREAERKEAQAVYFRQEWAKEEDAARRAWPELQKLYGELAQKFKLTPATLPNMDEVLAHASDDVPYPVRDAEITVRVLSWAPKPEHAGKPDYLDRKVHPQVTAAGQALGLLDQAHPCDPHWRNLWSRLRFWQDVPAPEAG